MTVERLAGILRDLNLEPTELDILDTLWLARYIDAPAGAATPQQAVDATVVTKSGHRPRRRRCSRVDAGAAGTDEFSLDTAPRAAGPEHSLHLRPAADWPGARGQRAVEIRAPAVPALPGHLDLARALRPFKRRVPSHHEVVVDEQATAARIADAGLWVPSLRPASARWLELALVIDGYESMSIWRELVNELRGLLERLGGFRDVRSWILDHPKDDPGRIALRKRPDSPLRSARELIDPGGRRVVIVVSDCLGPIWRTQAAQRVLTDWATRGPVAIVQPLPQRLWSHSHARPTPVRLHAAQSGSANAALTWKPTDSFASGRSARAVPIPVLQLDPVWLASWGKLIAATGTVGMEAMAIFAGDAAASAEPQLVGDTPVRPHERVQRFRATASPQAVRLAECLAAAPITLRIIRLVQEAMLGTTKQSHLAEVFLGGLLYRIGPDSDLDAEDVQYDFLPEVRDILLRRLDRTDAVRILYEVSNYIGVHFGQARDFKALLTGADISGDYLVQASSRPFAVVAEHVLRSLGGRYADSADRLATVLANVHTELVAEQEPREAATREAMPPVDGEQSATPATQPVIGTWSSVRSRRQPLVCPYCYSAFHERDILFRCEGRTGVSGTPCRRVVDQVLEQTMHQSAQMFPVFAARGRSNSAVCPNCHSPSRTQVCPGCHSRLPATFRTVQGRLIALVGPSQAGKTMFMTVMVHELRHRVGEQLNSSTGGADDRSEERFARDYEAPLYSQRELLPPTTTAGQVYVAPLVFRFTMPPSRLRQQPQQLLLSFADSAGEDLATPGKTDQMIRYLSAADGVIVLVDPLQLPAVRHLMHRGATLPVPQYGDAEPVGAVAKITKLFLEGDRRSGLIDKPVAVVMTKLDMLWDLLPADSPLRSPEPQGGLRDGSDSTAVDAQVQQLLDGWGAGELNRLIRYNYSQTSFFGVSALGAAPTPDNRISHVGVQPYRVMDPFLWLLTKFNFIRR